MAVVPSGLAQTAAALIAQRLLAGYTEHSACLLTEAVSVMPHKMACTAQMTALAVISEGLQAAVPLVKV